MLRDGGGGRRTGEDHSCVAFRAASCENIPKTTIFTSAAEVLGGRKID